MNTLALLVLARLMHVLMFAYWLAADIGAFYAAYLVADAALPAPARTAAGRVLFNVDMAPSTCLILALPTGLTLAVARGWLQVEALSLALVWMVALAWVGAVWKLHLSHGAPGWLARLDLIARWLFMLALAGAGALGVAKVAPLPLFLALKLLILSAAVALGLHIRVLLKPFLPAYAALMRGTPDPDDDTAIRRAIDKARAPVLVIWALVLAAAALGMATPT